ncbi:MAG: FAD binding domain-containing protein [Chloroflexota bacterium]
MKILDRFELGVGEADAPAETARKSRGYACFDRLPRFEHINAASVVEAVSLLKTYGGRAALIAGGQDLLSRLRGRVHPALPRVLINIKTVQPALDGIEETADGLVIGSLATLRRVETSPLVRRGYPVLGQAAYATRPLHYRNMATLGGDLCQQVRCWYYRASGNAYHCRRKGGSDCPALEGDNRYHAVLGSQACVAVCPADTAPALVALGASLSIAGSRGERTVPLEDFFTPLGNVLAPDEMVTGVMVPRPAADSRGTFLKFTVGNVFDRALVSVAVTASLEDGVCRRARIVLGAVSPQPYRAVEAERELAGRRPDAVTAARAAQAAVAAARPLGKNGYKVDIARVLVQRAILGLA